MGLDHGRLGVSWVYQKCGKCCKGGTGQWVLIMADWVSAGCTKDLAGVAKLGQANGCQTWQIGCQLDVEMEQVLQWWDRLMDHSHCRTGVG